MGERFVDNIFSIIIVRAFYLQFFVFVFYDYFSYNCAAAYYVSISCLHWIFYGVIIFARPPVRKVDDGTNFHSFDSLYTSLVCYMYNYNIEIGM